MAELVDQHQQHTAGKGSASARPSADRRADRQRHQRDGRQRGMQGTEQDAEVMRILMVIVVDPLPQRRGAGTLVEILAVQHEAMKQVLDQGIGRERQHDRQRQGPEPLGQSERKDGADHAQSDVGNHGRIGKVRRDQITQAHASKVVGASPPEPNV